MQSLIKDNYLLERRSSETEDISGNVSFNKKKIKMIVNFYIGHNF